MSLDLIRVASQVGEMLFSLKAGLGERQERLKNALGGTVRALASVVETRDPYTAGHQRRVAELALDRSQLFVDIVCH